MLFPLYTLEIAWLYINTGTLLWSRHRPAVSFRCRSQVAVVALPLLSR